MRSLGTLLVGLGAGFVLAQALGDLASVEGIGTLIAVALVVTGLFLQRRRPVELGAPPVQAAPQPVPQPAGLGEATDRLLRLAEQQAAEHIAAAKTEAARIIADAHAEATRLRE